MHNLVNTQTDREGKPNRITSKSQCRCFYVSVRFGIAELCAEIYIGKNREKMVGHGKEEEKQFLPAPRRPAGNGPGTKKNMIYVVNVRKIVPKALQHKTKRII